MNNYKYFIIIAMFLSSCKDKIPELQREETKIIVVSEGSEKVYKKDISNPNKTLSGKIKTLKLSYVVWGCACANWVETDKYEKYQRENTLSKNTIFIEPATEDLSLPEDFDPFKNRITIKGQFYNEPDYPKGTPETEEVLNKAPVFRYTHIYID